MADPASSDPPSLDLPYENIGFGEAIVRGYRKWAVVRGRASLGEYWWFVLFTFLGSAAAGIIGQALSGLFSLAVLLPSLAVGARRLHDTDRSGWFLLLWFIPFIGWIVLVIFAVQDSKEPNRFTIG